MGRNEAVKRERYRLIDSLRGFALLNMVAFHLCYDIFMIYGVDDNWALRPESVAWERFICVSFILISGISLNFSKHAYRRGLIVSGCGALITLVTAIAMPDEIILFGVLSCIGACMLIAQALRRLLEKCNPFAGAAAAFALFGFSYGLPDGFLGFFNTKLAVLPEELYRFRPLAFFGFPDADFYSSDYFPLFPWIFLFVCGFFLWRALTELNLDRLFVRGVPVLDYLGKYSLWIYMIHQPVLMGVCVLIFGGM